MNEFLSTAIIVFLSACVVLLATTHVPKSDDYTTFDEDVLEVTYGDITIVAPYCAVKLPGDKYVIIDDSGNSYLIEDASVDVKVLRSIT